VDRGRLDFCDSGQEPVAGSFTLSNKPSASVKAGDFLTSREPVNFSKRTLFHGVSWSLPIQLFVQGMKIKKLLSLHFVKCRPEIYYEFKQWFSIGIENTSVTVYTQSLFIVYICMYACMPSCIEHGISCLETRTYF
jgi:hypothetical protein